MAVSFDAATASSRAVGGADPFTFTHTPVGTPRGVFVGAAYGAAGSNPAVWGTTTYGGVTMTRLSSADAIAFKAAGEFGGTALWFLGTGIPTGAQTVSVDMTSDATSEFFCVTVTGANDTEVVDSEGKTNQAASNLAFVDLSYAGRTCLAVASVWTARNGPGDLTPAAGVTEIGAGVDHGSCSSQAIRQTTAGTTDFQIAENITIANDVWCMTAAAVAEINTARVTQLAIETLYTPTSNLRATQLAVETLVGPEPSFIPPATLIL